MTSKPRKTMASKAEQLPEVPPVRDEAAELAAQLAATQDSAESAAAPDADDDACPSTLTTDAGELECVVLRGHEGLHSDGEGITWSDVVSPDPDAAVEGEVVNDTAPICQQANHFPGGWKAIRPDAAMVSCSHGRWFRNPQD